MGKGAAVLWLTLTCVALLPRCHSQDTAVTGPTSLPAPQPGSPPGPPSTSAPTSNPLLPTVVSLVVMVLLLIICVDLLALALAVTATKLIKLRAEKALHCYNQAGGGEGRTAEEVYEEIDEGPRERRCHSDRLHCHNQTGGGEGEAIDRIYDEVGEGTDPIGGQKGHYQELQLETMDRRQYETLHGGH